MTDYMNANTINDLIRSIFALIDRVAYWLLGIMYEILFNVASADIFSNATIKNFYGRIQLILGVFMIFKLAISIIQGILNPDSFTDKKSGFGNIITRIITAIVLLAVLTPINIPAARNEYEIQLNNNGLLFGTLYSLQDRILENNTLGRLILGTTDNATAGSTSDGTVSGSDKQGERLAESADIFTSTILKGFVRINLKEKSQLNGQEPDETKASHRICENINQETLDAYTALDADPNQILSLVNASCEYEGGGFSDVLGFFKRLAGKDRYVFAYMPVVSTAVAVLFIYILLGEIITIAIRSIKLAVLRLIAPIPVISYIQPSKDGGAFGAWTKALISTYLELFLHLAVIYFVIFLIQDMIVNGIVINTGSGIIGIISMIFIWVGLFFFIRQAPKFIMNVLGVKGGGSNLGLSALLGGTAMAMGGGGLRGFASGALESANASTLAYNQGKTYGIGDAWNKQQDRMAQIRTGDKDARGGFMGQTMDMLDWSTRERRAGILGFGREDMAEAKYKKSVEEAKANAAAERLAVAEHRLSSLSDSATEAERRTAYDDYVAAYRANQSAQADLSSAEKNVKNIDSARSTLRVGPRAIDSVQETYRSPRKIATKKYSETAHYADTAPDGGYDVETTYKRATKADGTYADDRSQHQYTSDLNSYETIDDSTWASGGGPGSGPGPRP